MPFGRLWILFVPAYVSGEFSDLQWILFCFFFLFSFLSVVCGFFSVSVRSFSGAVWLSSREGKCYDFSSFLKQSVIEKGNVPLLQGSISYMSQPPPFESEQAPYPIFGGVRKVYIKVLPYLLWRWGWCCWVRSS